MTTPKKTPAKKAAAPDQGQATRTGASAHVPASAQPPGAPDPVSDAGIQISQWEFVDEIPTRERVVALLETLPPVWGIDTVDFADYVQVLPQNKKMKIPDGDRVKEVYLNCYTIYMTVAGRLAMLNAAAVLNGWAVEFRPEMGTAVPGFLDFGDPSGRIVYREYLVIEQIRGTTHQPLTIDDPNTDPLPRPVLLGSKPGMAWVPHQGGRNAAGSNPYEKVETAARGRAIAAWGFGVLPGSGVASVEEILNANDNRREMQAQPQGAVVRGGSRVSRETLLQELREVGEAYRMAKGWEVSPLVEFMGQYLSTESSDAGPGLGIAGSFDAESVKIDYTKVGDGNLALLIQHLRHLLNDGEDPA